MSVPMCSCHIRRFRSPARRSSFRLSSSARMHRLAPFSLHALATSRRLQVSPASTPRSHVPVTVVKDFSSSLARRPAGPRVLRTSLSGLTPRHRVFIAPDGADVLSRPRAHPQCTPARCSTPSRMLDACCPPPSHRHHTPIACILTQPSRAPRLRARPVLLYPSILCASV